jgi:hypothetical protein
VVFLRAVDRLRAVIGLSSPQCRHTKRVAKRWSMQPATSRAH